MSWIQLAFSLCWFLVTWFHITLWHMFQHDGSYDFKWQLFNGGGLRLLCWLFCLNTFFLPFFDPNSPRVSFSHFVSWRNWSREDPGGKKNVRNDGKWDDERRSRKQCVPGLVLCNLVFCFPGRNLDRFSNLKSSNPLAHRSCFSDPCSIPWELVNISASGV